MDRFVIKEPRIGADYPQGNQMIAYSASGGINMIPPETIYLGGPFASEFPNGQRENSTLNMQAMQHNINPQTMTVQHGMTRQLGITSQHGMAAQHNITPQHGMAAQHGMTPQNGMTAQHGMTAQQSMTIQRPTMIAQHSMNTHHSMNHQNNMHPQMAQAHGYSHDLPAQGHMSGIDPRYLEGYNDNSAQFILTGQQAQRNGTPINSSFGTDYQKRSFNGIDRNKHKSFAPKASFGKESPRVDSSTAMPKPQPRSMILQDRKNISPPQQINSVPETKPNELDLLRNDTQNKIMTRADKLKVLHKSGPRAFSGTVEKVLKWHKSLQEIGILIFYEIVAKCVSVRKGDSCSNNLVVRDDNGPAMQVVYYEIDFLLPDLKPPCTIRVVGRMMPGTSRLQAFNVRPATGDDVATLPRRAAVAAHHVAKLCKEYEPNPQ